MGEYKMKWIKNSNELLKILIDEEKREIAKSPIAFIDGKLYYFVPIAKQIIENENVKARKGKKGGRRKENNPKEGDSRGIQVITYLGVLGASQGIIIVPNDSYTPDTIAHPENYSKYFTQLDFEIGGVNFTYYKNQDVKLRRCIKEALFEPEKVWKSDSSEIFTLVDILQY
ncbi:hypothetical protein DRP04_12535, partial [Archaeoglobales archaeon]